MILFLAHALHSSALPYLLAVILASNIGGTAILIGDPPNIIIGSAAGLDFAAFLVNLAPLALIIFAVFVPTILLLFRQELRVDAETRATVMALDTARLSKDKRMLAVSLRVLGAVMVGFLLQGVGFVQMVAGWLLGLTGSDLRLTTMVLLWLSGVASGIVANIPYAATIVPIVQKLGTSMPSGPLWWPLALGACLGGNATIVGASANVIVAGPAERGASPSASVRS